MTGKQPQKTEGLVRARDLPSIVKEVSLRDIQRIDMALEGDWNTTVVCVWRRENGFAGFGNVVRKHQNLKPSMELYFVDTWVGLHCYKKSENMNVLDEEYAMSIISFVASKVNAGTSS